MLLETPEKSERRLFTYEERKAILARTHQICACCGKKLTTKTMTIDHIIPISRGGTNEMENLVALCETCNTEKGNIIYMPCGYYTAIYNNSEILKMQGHVQQWFYQIKDKFDITHYPLIAPRNNIQLILNHAKPTNKRKYNRQWVIQWRLINNNDIPEIEAVTDVDVRYIRKVMPSFYQPTETYTDPDRNMPTVALYSLRKLSSDKILAIAAIQFCPDKNHINIWLPWCDVSTYHQPQILYGLVNMLFGILQTIAGYSIQNYTLFSKYPKTLTHFTRPGLEPYLGFSYEPVKLPRYADPEIKGILIHRTNYRYPNTIAY